MMPQDSSRFTDEELLDLAKAPGSSPYLNKLSDTEQARLVALLKPGLKPALARDRAEQVLHPFPRPAAAMDSSPDPIVGMAAHLANPQNLQDFLQLLIPSAGGVGVVPAARSFVGATRAAPDAAVTGINQLATKVATSPKITGTAGTVAGTIAGAQVGHPWIGMSLGRQLAGPLIQSGAEGLETLTGGRAVQTGLTTLDREQLVKQGMPSAAIERIEAALKAGQSTPSHGTGVAPLSDAAYEAATGGPRGSLSLQALRQAPSSAPGAPGVSGGASQALPDLFGGDRTTGSFGAGPGSLRDVPRMLAESRGTTPPVDPIAKALGLPPGSRVLQMKPAGLQALAREKGAAEATTLLNRTGQLPEAWQRLLPAEQRNALAGLRGGPRGGLPLEAQREIDQALAGLSAADAKAYLMRAPNPAAYNYILHKIRGE